MGVNTIKEEFYKQKIQVIQLNTTGEILESDNTLFTLKKGTLLHDAHPFFYAITAIIPDLKETLQFPCVNIEIEETQKIIDIEVLKKNNQFYVVFIDFTKHYEDSHPLVQEKNESFITKNKLAFEREILYAKEEFKNNFLANINHEIRSPLNNLLGFTEILEKTKLTFQQKETLSVISKTGSHIKLLMDDMLDISKIESGSLTLKNVPFNLNNVVVTIVKHFQLKYVETGIELRYFIDKKVPIKLYGDPTRLNQILHNILENAFRNTTAGYIEIHISLQDIKNEQAIIDFKISDSGKGITKHEIEKIFDSYIQLQINKLAPVGEGLGLKIVKDLTSLLGGTITVKSKKGEGSVFTTQLPFKTREKTTRRKSIPKGSGIFKSRRVLAVEDDQISQMLLMKQFLENEKGFFLDLAKKGAQALNMLVDKSYDIIIIKSNLSDLTGLEFIEQVRTHQDPKIASTPIVVASGMTMIEEQEQMIAAGATTFLKKPYTQKDLIRTLNKL